MLVSKWIKMQGYLAAILPYFFFLTPQLVNCIFTATQETFQGSQGQSDTLQTPVDATLASLTTAKPATN